MEGKIAIIGAGPSGCYVAQALLKAKPELQVDIVDALPVPFGLVRYGVAADHQGTKAVARQFARIFERQGARFFGNVHVGRDVSLQRLRDAYDAVVVAAGLSQDRTLDIPGASLAGVYGSARLTRLLHEHPEAQDLPDLGAHPLILGNGNVAIDLLRILCKAPDELAGTDLGPGPTAWLAANTIKTISVIGRSPAALAKFDPAMIRDLRKLQRVSIDIVDAGHSGASDSRLEALSSIHSHGHGPIKVTFRFGLLPRSVEGKEHVTGLHVQGPGGEETIAASSILTAIGYISNGDLDRDSLLRGMGSGGDGKLADRLFAAGWFRRGARGTIADSRTEAQAIAASILEELDPDPARPGSEIFRDLPEVVDFAGWQRIDAAELTHKTPERCRVKISSTAELLRVAGQREESR